MRRFLSVAIVVTVASAAFGVGYSPVTPHSGAQVQSVVNAKGERNVYYLLTPDSPLTYQVTGKTKLSVRTRAAVRPVDLGTAKYTMEVWIDGEKVRSYSASAGVAEGMRFEGNAIGAVGLLRKLGVSVPKGEHTVELRLVSGPAQAVAVRVLRPRKKTITTPPSTTPRPKLVALAPISSARPVAVVTRESETTYYLATPDKPVTLRVVGPVKVTLRMRLAFTALLQGAKSARITVTENEREVTSRSRKFERSTVSSFKGMRQWVPSAAKELTFSVPDGVHTYTVAFSGVPAPALAVKVLIPASAVGQR
jgi:hypothetical protein